MSAVIWLIENGATFAELFCGYLFCSTFISDQVPSRTRAAVLCTVSTLLMYLASSFISFSPASFLIGLALLLGTQALLFHKHPLKACLFAAVFVPIDLIADNILVRSVSFMAQISFASIYEEQTIYRMLALIASKTLLLFLTLMIRSLFKGIKEKEWRYMTFLSVSTAIMFLLASTLTFADVKNGSVSSWVSVAFFSSMLVMLFTVYFGTYALLDRYQARQEAAMVEMKNRMLLRSMQETERTFLLWRTALHDHKHRIAALKAMADKGDLAEISAFLEGETELFRQKLFYYKTGNDAVDVILNMKQHHAESRKIPFIIHGTVPEGCPLSDMHFTAVLGNLLDNALEAAEKAEDPFVEVKLGEVRGQFMINVSNRYNAQAISAKDQQFHGIGLRSVRKIIRDYDGELLIEQGETVYQSTVLVAVGNGGALSG